MTFTTFLRAIKGEDTAYGDFADDWLADRDSPKDPRALTPILRHLTRRNACPQAVATARKLWTDYQGANA